MAEELNLKMIVEMIDKASPELKKLDENIGMSGKMMAGLAAGAAVAVIGAFGAVVKSVADTADEMGKLSQKVGITVENLSFLKYAGDLSGISLEGMTQGFKKLSSAMVEASGNASGDFAKRFKDLDVAVVDANGNLRDTFDVFTDVAEAFSKLESNAAKTEMAVKLFGKAGLDMIPLLNSGKEGIAAMKDEAEKMGLIMSEKTAKAAEQFNDNLTRMSASVRGIAIEFAGPVIESLARITDEFIRGAKEGGTLLGIWEGLKAAGNTIIGSGVTQFEQSQEQYNKLIDQRVRLQQQIIKQQKEVDEGGIFSFINAQKLKEFQEALKEVDDKIAAGAETRQKLIDQYSKEQQARDAVKKLLTTETDEQKKATEEKKKFLDALKIEAETIGLTAYQKRLYEAETIASKIATEGERLEFLKSAEAYARKIKAHDDLIESVKRYNEMVGAEIDKEEALQNAINDSIKALRLKIESLTFENSLYGKTNAEREVAITQHTLEAAGYNTSTEASKKFLETLRTELNVKSEQSKIAELLSKTDLEKTKNFYKDMELLDKAYFEGLKDSSGKVYLQLSDEQYKQAVEQLTGLVSKNEEAKNEITEFWREAAKNIQGSLGNFFFDFMQGKLSDLGASMKNMIDRMVANILAAKAATALFGSGFEKGGSIGGIVGSIGSAIFRESGGPVYAGQSVIVGEKRPELFVPKTDGTIVPNLSGLGGNTVQISISALDGQDVMRVLGSKQREIAEMINSTNLTYNLRGR